MYVRPIITVSIVDEMGEILFTEDTEEAERQIDRYVIFNSSFQLPLTYEEILEQGKIYYLLIFIYIFKKVSYQSRPLPAPNKKMLQT